MHQAIIAANDPITINEDLFTYCKPLSETRGYLGHSIQCAFEATRETPNLKKPFAGYHLLKEMLSSFNVTLSKHFHIKAPDLEYRESFDPNLGMLNRTLAFFQDDRKIEISSTIQRQTIPELWANKIISQWEVNITIPDISKEITIKNDLFSSGGLLFSFPVITSNGRTCYILDSQYAHDLIPEKYIDLDPMDDPYCLSWEQLEKELNEQIYSSPIITALSKTKAIIVTLTCTLIALGVFHCLRRVRN